MDRSRRGRVTNIAGRRLGEDMVRFGRIRLARDRRRRFRRIRRMPRLWAWTALLAVGAAMLPAPRDARAGEAVTSRVASGGPITFDNYPVGTHVAAEYVPSGLLIGGDD